ncbi:MAG: hemerythrin domain-containing protein [Pseudomonadota bacterium]|nr:hemerythrin domain-containing protein [Pseudomonadota bacterium]
MSILAKVIEAVTPSSNDGEVDAIDLLKQDHDEVDTLFDEYERLTDDDAAEHGDKRALSTEICGMLAVHAMVEEELFYPAARKAGVESALLDEAEVEHGSVKQLIADIGASTPEHSLYDARVKVLGEYVKHHVKEEEGELFSACRKAGMETKVLGATMLARKDELMRKLDGKKR